MEKFSNTSEIPRYVYGSSYLKLKIQTPYSSCEHWLECHVTNQEPHSWMMPFWDKFPIFNLKQSIYILIILTEINGHKACTNTTAVNLWISYLLLFVFPKYSKQVVLLLWTVQYLLWYKRQSQIVTNVCQKFPTLNLS